MSELLSYKKSQLRLAMRTLGKLGLGEEKLDILRVVLDVAELAGTVFDVHLKGWSEGQIACKEYMAPKIKKDHTLTCALCLKSPTINRINLGAWQL